MAGQTPATKADIAEPAPKAAGSDEPAFLRLIDAVPDLATTQAAPQVPASGEHPGPTSPAPIGQPAPSPAERAGQATTPPALLSPPPTEPAGIRQPATVETAPTQRAHLPEAPIRPSTALPQATADRAPPLAEMAPPPAPGEAEPSPAPLPSRPATPEPAAPSGIVRAAQSAGPDPLAQDAAKQVSRAVAVTPGERTVEVRLDPPSLGRVRIEFDFSGDTVRAIVSAAEPETLTLLKRGSQVLSRDLAEIGLGEAEIEYAEERRRDPGEHAPRTLFVPSPSPAAAAASGDAAPLRVRRHDGALDITL